MYWLYCPAYSLFPIPIAYCLPCVTLAKSLCWPRTTALCLRTSSFHRPQAKLAKKHINPISDQFQTNLSYFFVIFTWFGCLRWIRNGNDLQNPFVNCRFHSFFWLYVFLENVLYIWHEMSKITCYVLPIDCRLLALHAHMLSNLDNLAPLPFEAFASLALRWLLELCLYLRQDGQVKWKRSKRRRHHK